MGLCLLTTLVSAWLVCTGAHVIDKRQVRYTNLELCVDTDVSIGANSNLFVKSPNYGNGNYRDNTRCNLVLRSGSDTLFVTAKILAIDLESQGTCGYDYICLGGYLFCGQWAANQEYTFIIPAHRNFTLDFKTDGSETGRGFQVNIVAAQFGGQTGFTPVSGYGSSSSSLSLGHLTYTSNYSDTYQDRCRVDNANNQWSYTSSPWYYPTSQGYYTDNSWNYQTSPSYYTDNWQYYQTSPSYYTNNLQYYQTSPNYYTSYPWYYSTSHSPNYNTDYPWYYQTSPNYYTDYPWYYSTSHSPNYNTDYPWYYQTSASYYTDYPYYYNTSPARRQDTTFILYFLYEALSTLGQANYNSELAIQNVQRAIAHLEGNIAGKK